MSYDLTKLNIPDFTCEGNTGPNGEAVYRHDTTDAAIDIEYLEANKNSDYPEENNGYEFVVTYWEGSNQQIIFQVDDRSLTDAFDKLAKFLQGDKSEWF